MTDEQDLNSDGKPRFRLADADDIANMSTAFTLPGRLAKQLADREKRIEQQRAIPELPDVQPRKPRELRNG
jgi:hypothetical protein